VNRALTTRQRQVIEAAMRGLTAREIAAELGNTPDTVRTIKSDILLRLGAKNMVHAAVLYERQVSA
jgi:DNA-binding NarL/FixJ family response regulator